MTRATDNARSLAEDAFAYTPLGPGSERETGVMSKPILERLGFQQVATVHALVDRA